MVDRVVGSGRGRDGVALGVREAVVGVVEGKKRDVDAWVNDKTRVDVGKVLAFKSTEQVDAFVQAATQYAVSPLGAAVRLRD